MLHIVHSGCCGGNRHWSRSRLNGERAASSACALSSVRERELRARSGLKANAAGDEKTSGGDETRRSSTSQDPALLQRNPRALSGRVTAGDGGGHPRPESIGCSVDLAGDWSAASPLLLSLESGGWGADSCVPFFSVSAISVWTKPTACQWSTRLIHACVAWISTSNLLTEESAAAARDSPFTN